MKILNIIKMAIYSTYITNKYGFMLKNENNNQKKKLLRLEYAKRLMSRLNIKIEVVNKHKIPTDGKYLLISNHKSIIDPVIIEIALENSDIFGYWVSKKELYNSFFFGLFTRNSGTILLNREAKSMAGFFKDIKSKVVQGDSIFMFPEGTRNKTSDNLLKFKDGTQIIAIKNRLQIFPVCIKTNANEVLKEAIENNKIQRTITIDIGDMIDAKAKANIQDSYEDMFYK